MEECEKDISGRKDQSPFVRYFCDSFAVLSNEEMKELYRFLEITPKASSLCLDLLISIRDLVLATLKEKSRYMGVLLERLLLPILSLLKNKASMILTHVLLRFCCEL